MTLYCHYDGNRVKGFYDDEIHKEIPTPNFEVTEQNIKDCTSGFNTHFTREDGELKFFKEDISLTLEQRQDIVRRRRSQLYRDNADSLYLEWQFDRTSESETIWREAVQRIKDENPIPFE